MSDLGPDMADRTPPGATLADIYDEHVWHVYGFFGYHRLSRQDAEDLTQATFERAVRAFARYDPARASPKTWLMAIAQNLLIDHYRREHSRRHYSLDDDVEDEQLGSTAGPEGLGLSPRLALALEILSPRERELIALRFGGDLRGPEIAELLDLSLANVQQIASRALRKLRAELDDEAEPNAAEPAVVTTRRS
jgi:RNA polymerase sigma factor (sigma-70 family)